MYQGDAFVGPKEWRMSCFAKAFSDPHESALDINNDTTTVLVSFREGFTGGGVCENVS